MSIPEKSRIRFYMESAALPLPPLELLPPERQSRVQAALSRAKARDLAWAWLLLRHAFASLGFDEALLAACRRTASGKPVLPGGAPHFQPVAQRRLGRLRSFGTQPVGLDIQTCRRILARFYAPYLTSGDLAATPDEPKALCRLWARKEAVLKWLGTGWTTEAKRSLSVLASEQTLNGVAVAICDQWVAPDVCVALCAPTDAQPDIHSISPKEARDFYRID